MELKISMMLLFIILYGVWDLVIILIYGIISFSKVSET